MDLNPSSPVPLYQQFKLLMERKIASNTWAPDEPMPTEMSLVEAYGISRTTVRQALDELVRDGRIYRQRGKGTFIAAPKIVQTLGKLTGFAEELALKGLALTIEVLAHHIIAAPFHVTEALQMPANMEVLHTRRLVSVIGEPLFVDDSYFPSELAVHLSRERIQMHPIYQLLEISGRSPAAGEQRLEAIAILNDIAKHLAVKPGAPGLAVSRVTKDHLGVPLEYTSAVYRGDRYHYSIRLHR